MRIILADHSGENHIQSTLAITIRGVTITWLKRFDVMESIIFLGK